MTTSLEKLKEINTETDFALSDLATQSFKIEGRRARMRKKRDAISRLFRNYENTNNPRTSITLYNANLGNERDCFGYNIGFSPNYLQTTIHQDPVYQKLQGIRDYVFHHGFRTLFWDKEDVRRKINDFLIRTISPLVERKMTEAEYDHLLKTPAKQIVRDIRSGTRKVGGKYDITN